MLPGGAGAGADAILELLKKIQDHRGGRIVFESDAAQL